MVNGDKIIGYKDELLNLLTTEGWSSVDSKDTLNSLCYLDVKMIDEREDTDSFFLHF